jgi:hypothetical protein
MFNNQGVLHALNDTGCPRHTEPESKALLLLTHHFLEIESSIVTASTNSSDDRISQSINLSVIEQGKERHFYHTNDIKVIVRRYFLY